MPKQITNRKQKKYVERTRSPYNLRSHKKEAEEKIDKVRNVEHPEKPTNSVSKRNLKKTPKKTVKIICKKNQEKIQKIQDKSSQTQIENDENDVDYLANNGFLELGTFTSEDMIRIGKDDFDHLYNTYAEDDMLQRLKTIKENLSTYTRTLIQEHAEVESRKKFRNAQRQITKIMIDDGVVDELSRQLTYKVQVPGQGDCLFHSILLILSSFGFRFDCLKDVQEIRNKVAIAYETYTSYDEWKQLMENEKLETDREKEPWWRKWKATVNRKTRQKDYKIEEQVKDFKTHLLEGIRTVGDFWGDETTIKKIEQRYFIDIIVVDDSKVLDCSSFMKKRNTDFAVLNIKDSHYSPVQDKNGSFKFHRNCSYYNRKSQVI